MKLTNSDITKFQKELWEHYAVLGRDGLPWRLTHDPYCIMVSEIMLQQTQVSRVIQKYEAFIASFPTVAALSSAPLSSVLELWSGLGYNRRAKFLLNAARLIDQQLDGMFPKSMKELCVLPGVGINTAGAIMAYAYNQPAIYIETNVRTVYFHHFFEENNLVDDAQLREILEQTIDRDHPREFYWALMDYGSWLKQQGLARNDQSRHYKKQSPLKGSVREVRGMIISALLQHSIGSNGLRRHLGLEQDVRYDKALKDLIKEELVQPVKGQLRLTDQGLLSHNE